MPRCPRNTAFVFISLFAVIVGSTALSGTVVRRHWLADSSLPAGCRTRIGGNTAIFNSFTVPPEWYSCGGSSCDCHQPSVLLSSAISPGQVITLSGITGNLCMRYYPRSGSCTNNAANGCSENGHSNLISCSDTKSAMIGFYNNKTLIQEIPLKDALAGVTAPSGADALYAYFRESDGTNYFDNNGGYACTFVYDISAPVACPASSSSSAPAPASSSRSSAPPLSSSSLSGPIPTLSITAPVSGTYTAGTPITIQWTTSTMPAGTKISLGYDSDGFWNGNETWIEDGQVTVTNGAQSYQWDTTGVPAGTYHALGYVTDPFTGAHLDSSYSPLTFTIRTAALSSSSSSSSSLSVQTGFCCTHNGSMNGNCGITHNTSCPNGALISDGTFYDSRASCLQACPDELNACNEGDVPLYEPDRYAMTPDGKTTFQSQLPNTVWVSDMSTTVPQLTKTIPVGKNPGYPVVITGDGKTVYVANVGDGTVSVIDTASESVKDTIAIPGVLSIAVTADGKYLYATRAGTGFTVINTGTKTPATILGGSWGNPKGVILARDGTSAFMMVSSHLDTLMSETKTGGVFEVIEYKDAPGSFGIFGALPILGASNINACLRGPEASDMGYCCFTSSRPSSPNCDRYSADFCKGIGTFSRTQAACMQSCGGSSSVSSLDIASSVSSSSQGNQCPNSNLFSSGIVAFSPTKAYVATNGPAGSLDVTNLGTNSLEKTMLVRYAKALALSATRAYVVSDTPDGGGVEVFDLATNQQVATSYNPATRKLENGPILVGVHPGAIALSATKAYVVNGGGGLNPSGGSVPSGSVSVINLSTNMVEKTVEWKSALQNAGPSAIALTATKAYVTDSLQDIVAVIDLASNTVEKEINVGFTPDAIALTATKAYVVNWQGSISNNPDNVGSVSVIDLATNEVEKTVTVGSYPESIALSATKAYVTNYGSNSVSVIDLGTNEVEKTVAVGRSPGKIIIWGTNAYVVGNDNSVSVIDLPSNTLSCGTPVPASSASSAANQQGYCCYTDVAPSDNCELSLKDACDGFGTFSLSQNACTQSCGISSSSVASQAPPFSPYVLCGKICKKDSTPLVCHQVCISLQEKDPHQFLCGNGKVATFTCAEQGAYGCSFHCEP